MGNLAYKGEIYILNDGSTGQGEADAIMEGCCCDDAESCPLCASCITVRVNVSVGFTMLYANIALSPTGPSTPHCYKTYSCYNVDLRDENQLLSGSYISFTIITMTSGSMGILSMTVVLDTAEHCTSVSRLIELEQGPFGGNVFCGPWSVSSGENNKTTFSYLTMLAFKDSGDNWDSIQAQGDIYVQQHAAFPYNKGNAAAYKVLNVSDFDLLACAGVPDPGEPAWDGIMPGYGPWSYTGTHHGIDIHVRLKYKNNSDEDETFNKYWVVFQCGTQGFAQYRQEEVCGDPTGTYIFVPADPSDTRDLPPINVETSD